MTFHTERLYIRKLTKDDIHHIHNMNTHEKVAEFNTIGIPKSISETEGMLKKLFEPENKTALGWSVWLKNKDVFIGELGMNLSSPRFKMAEIHYSILPEFWGKGYATEAVHALLAFGFNGLDLHRIEAGVAIENVASIRVLEKTGMIKEGQKRKILPIRGEWKDNYQYAILEEDFISIYT